MSKPKNYASSLFHNGITQPQMYAHNPRHERRYDNVRGFHRLRGGFDIDKVQGPPAPPASNEHWEFVEGGRRPGE
jgi:hypothetical protein